MKNVQTSTKETLTEKTNRLALQVKEEGLESYAFVELFELVNNETIKPKAKSFRTQLKGDVQAGESVGYKVLMKTVEEWKGTGSFHRMFTVAFKNELINLVHYLGRNKRKHNTNYEISLSYTNNKEDESDNIDISYGRQLETEFDCTGSLDGEPTLEDLLTSFALKYPERYDIIMVLLPFEKDNSTQAERTEALCNYFGVQKYTGVIQKRVSRARQSFYKHLLENGYDVSYINY